MNKDIHISIAYLLEDVEKPVRINTINALAGINPSKPEILQALMKQLEDDDFDIQSSTNIAFRLIKLNSSEFH